MFKNTALFLTITLCLAIGTAFAGNCNNGNFPGSYTRVDAPTDVFGDGTEIHQFIYQLTLNADGSVQQYWTGLPDYQINVGTGTPSYGSWKCRADGKLVVNIITANYAPVTPGGNVTFADVRLAGYFRTTILFNVNNQNTLTRIQSRNRTYTAAQDPTDQSAGTLGAVSNTQFTYKRLVANDDDLNLP